MEKADSGVESARDPRGAVWDQKLMKRCMPGKMDTKRGWVNVQTNPRTRRMKGARQKRERVERRRRKENSHKEGMQKAERGMFSVRFRGAKRCLSDSVANF